MNKVSLILASGSPRRSELMHMITDEFTVLVSECEEVVTSIDPIQVTMELSKQKAEAVALNHMELKNVLLIGADTVVSVDHCILGKPEDRADAYRMISSLEGRSHQVTTGVTLLWVNEKGMVERNESFSETTRVNVVSMADNEINEYLDTDEPYDKAGAYGIQGKFGKFIKSIEGDYYNVVGLPVQKLYKKIKDFL